MDSFGIHSIKTTKGCAYFIVRPFGNLLIFADYISFINRDLLKSLGGLSKMLFESRTNISTIHQELFNSFGASAVSDFLSEEFNSLLPLQRWNYEHVDPAIDWYHHGQKQMITFKQQEKNVCILGKELFLDNNTIMFQGRDISSEMLTFFNSKKVNLVYATHFSKGSCLVLK